MSLHRPTRSASWLVPSHLLHLKPLSTRDKSPVTMYSTSPLVNQFFTYCALTSGCLHSFPTDTTLPLSTTATNHHFSISCLHIQSFVKKASSPFSHKSTKLFHCWCHKYQVISIQQLTLDVDQPSRSQAYVLTTVQACVYMTQLCG